MMNALPVLIVVWPSLRACFWLCWLQRYITRYEEKSTLSGRCKPPAPEATAVLDPRKVNKVLPMLRVLGGTSASSLSSSSPSTPGLLAEAPILVIAGNSYACTPAGILSPIQLARECREPASVLRTGSLVLLSRGPKRCRYPRRLPRVRSSWCGSIPAAACPLARRCARPKKSRWRL